MTEEERRQVIRDVRAMLSKLDGSDVTTLSLLTGFTAEEIDALGGLP